MGLSTCSAVEFSREGPGVPNAVAICIRVRNIPRAFVRVKAFKVDTPSKFDTKSAWLCRVFYDQGTRVVWSENLFSGSHPPSDTQSFERGRVGDVMPYLCAKVSQYVCTCVWIFVCMHIFKYEFLCVSECVSVSMYACMHVCVCVWHLAHYRNKNDNTIFH